MSRLLSELTVAFALAAATSLAVAGPELRPPVPQTFVTAEYPAVAPDEARVVDVELELIVEADGTVSAATVVVSGGDEFDAAAVQAVRRFIFRPATKDRVAIAARIRYRYVFEPPPPSRPHSRRTIRRTHTRRDCVVTPTSVPRSGVTVVSAR